MKQFFLILLLLLLIAVSHCAHAQKVVGPIITNGAADEYSTHYDSLGYAGLRVVADTIERNAITTQRRKIGMVASCVSDATFYQLQGGIANSNWQKLSISGGGNDHNWFNIKQRGADTTGATDASALIQSAVNAGYKVFYVPKGKYLINSTIQLKDSVTIIGDGGKNSLFLLSSNITAFKLGFVLGGKNCEFRDIGFIGTYNSTGSTAQKGIVVDSVFGVNIYNIGCTNLGGFLVNIRKTGYCCAAYTYTATKGNSVSNCNVQDSYGGILIDSVGEYVGISNNNVSACRYGVKVLGGNCRIINNNLSGNIVGLMFGPSSNEGHGLADGNIINHCDTLLYATNINRGLEMGNNYFVVGKIVLNSCDHVTFTGGSYWADGGVYVTNCTDTHFTDFAKFWGLSSTWTITGTQPTFVDVNASGIAVSNITTRSSATDLPLTQDTTSNGQFYRTNNLNVPGNISVGGNLSTGGFTSISAGFLNNADGAITKQYTSLGTISANRTATLPTVPANTLLYIKTANSSGGTFYWSVDQSIYNPNSTTFTQLDQNTVYTFYYTGSQWYLFSKQQ